jgi:hypothetical protein
MTKPPILDEETDAEVAEKADGTWIGVKNFSVHIIKTDEGVVVDIYARGYEDCDTLGSTYVFDTEADEMRAAAEDEEEVSDDA